MSSIYVCNASPIVLLARIGSLHLVVTPRGDGVFARKKGLGFR